MNAGTTFLTGEKPEETHCLCFDVTGFWFSHVFTHNYDWLALFTLAHTILYCHSVQHANIFTAEMIMNEYVGSIPENAHCWCECSVYLIKKNQSFLT